MKFSALMKSSTQGKDAVCKKSNRILPCLAILFALATISASAQTTVSPATSTIQIAGAPDTLNPVTAPQGGLILYGTAISPTTNQPVRHLWVADANAGICRIDPDLDSPGPYAMNPSTCVFQLNGSRITGAGMVLDPTSNLLYFADPKQGVFQITYVAEGDSGNGSLDFSTLFGMGGNPSGSIFPGGQTGCSLPGNPNSPGSVALDPEGNLWLGSKSASLIRFNDPATASAGISSCQAFIQAVATTPNNRVVTGLAWIGHDLWGADTESPFMIPDADIACLVPPNPACSPANGTVVATLPSIKSPTGLAGDQLFPNTNGDNLYFGMNKDVAWLGNAGAAAADQTLTLGFIDPSISLANVGAVVVDATDPANLVAYAGDDPSGLGTTGAGRWFQTTLTSSGPAAPGAPLNVTAVGDDSQVTLSWSPAQTGQAVSSYTVHNNFASNGVTVGDFTLSAAGSLPPPTSTTIPGLTNFVSYQFQVLAGNAAGSSAYGTSNLVTPPGLEPPGTPGGAHAIAGDAQAYVTWTPPVNSGVVPIRSYTVTALQGGNSTGITATVAAPATHAIVSGLTNGKSYTFTVHASNGVGSSGESAQSSSITPLASILPVMKIEVNGPGSVTSVPTLVTYQVVVTNTSLFPATNVLINNVLSTTDFAYIVSAQPDQGFCTPGGSGVTLIVCSLGRMKGQQIVTINVTAQMQGAQIADTARVTGTDQNGDSLTFKIEHRATSPPSGGSPATSTLPSISVPVSVSVSPTSLHPLDSGTITWTVSDSTQTAAEDVVFFITVDTGLTVDSITVTPNSGANAASCSSPFPGLIGTNGIVCTIASLGGPQVNGVNPVQTMTVQLKVTAPNQSGLTFLPSGTVSFLGNDSSQSTASVQLKVH